MINLTTLFVFSIIILMIFSFISNSSPTALSQIALQFSRITCPLPLGNGVDYLNGTIAYNVDINGNTASYHDNTNPTVGTFYICDADPITGNLQESTIIKEYGYNCFGFIPCGFWGFTADQFSAIGSKLVAIGALLAYVVAPINFSIAGYTIASIGTIALAFVIMVYIFCYIFIGLFLYKALLPTGSVS